jgi:hypothetical protein
MRVTGDDGALLSAPRQALLEWIEV